MNLREEVDSYTKSNFNPTIEELVEHLEETIVNSLEDLAYDVRRSNGPDIAHSCVQDLINEIKANASAQSED